MKVPIQLCSLGQTNSDDRKVQSSSFALRSVTLLGSVLPCLLITDSPFASAPLRALRCVHGVITHTWSVPELSPKGAKVTPTLFLINDVPRHEDVWGSGSIAPAFLTSALDVSEWSGSRPGRFSSGERAPSTHWVGGWVDPDPVRTLWDRGKQFLLLLAFQPVATHLTD
jgi:hypothetical protein